MKRTLALLCVFCLLGACVGAQAEELRVYHFGGMLEYEMRGNFSELYPNRFDSAKKLFDLAHPNTNIEYLNRRFPPTPYENMLQRIAMDDQNASIMLLTDANLHAWYAQGKIIDLYTYEPMRDAMETWPDIANLLGDGTHLYAVPESFTTRLIEVADPTLYELLDISIDEDSWTWDDYFDIADDLYIYNEKNGTDYMFTKTYMPQWLSQFIYNECIAPVDDTVDVEALENMLARWKTIVERGQVLDPTIESDAKTLFVEGGQNFDIRANTMDLVPPTYADGIRRTQVLCFAYVIPAASANQQASLDFLAAYCQPEVVANSASYKWNGIFVRGMEDALTREGMGTMPEDSKIARWNKILETGYPYIEVEIHESARELLGEYIAGNLTLEKCTSRLAEACRYTTLKMAQK